MTKGKGNGGSRAMFRGGGVPGTQQQRTGVGDTIPDMSSMVLGESNAAPA